MPPGRKTPKAPAAPKKKPKPTSPKSPMRRPHLPGHASTPVSPMWREHQDPHPADPADPADPLWQRKLEAGYGQGAPVAGHTPLRTVPQRETRAQRQARLEQEEAEAAELDAEPDSASDIELLTPGRVQKKKPIEAQVKPPRVLKAQQVSLYESDEAVVRELEGKHPNIPQHMLVKALREELDKLNASRRPHADLPEFSMRTYIKKFFGTVDRIIREVDFSVPTAQRYPGLDAKLATGHTPPGIKRRMWKQVVLNMIEGINKENKRNGEPPVELDELFSKKYKKNLDDAANNTEPVRGDPRQYEGWLKRRIKGWGKMGPEQQGKQFLALNERIDPMTARKYTPGYAATVKRYLERAKRAFHSTENIPPQVQEFLQQFSTDVDIITEERFDSPEPRLLSPVTVQEDVLRPERSPSPEPAGGRDPSPEPVRSIPIVSKEKVIAEIVEVTGMSEEAAAREFNKSLAIVHSLARDRGDIQMDPISVPGRVWELIQEDIQKGHIASQGPADALLSASGNYVNVQSVPAQVMPVIREGLEGSHRWAGSGTPSLHGSQRTPSDGGMDFDRSSGSAQSAPGSYHASRRGYSPPADNPAAQLINANSTVKSAHRYASPARPRNVRPVRVVRPGRMRAGKPQARTTGGMQGWDVQRRPNFSIEETGPKTFTLVAREVNSGVYAQIVSLLKRVKSKFLIVDSRRMTKKQALKYIMPALRKGSVHVKLP